MRYDLQRLTAMRQLGVRWRHGRLPCYPATMSDHEKRKADQLYDAMSNAFVEYMLNRPLTARR